MFYCDFKATFATLCNENILTKTTLSEKDETYVYVNVLVHSVLN
jgi:hypothetical protein